MKTEGLCLQEMICRSRWGNKQTVIFSSSDVTTKMLFTLSPHGGLISKNQVYLSLSSNGYYGCSFTEIFQLDTLILILFIYIFYFLLTFINLYHFLGECTCMEPWRRIKQCHIRFLFIAFGISGYWKDNSFGDFLFFYLFICVCGFFFLYREQFNELLISSCML